ncbi:hypothetical protein [Candidatus Stoquefichus sp. SB1]|uniref:hypothetical protein n=1 Tax=Candidatus Stoquefichus sp. SB1 TaxID=1658109 RepID=UPI00067F40D9|nr:hypothetical protein [Candidatus Stoquefichus sp. SB1]
MCESIRKFKEDNIRQGKIEGRMEGRIEGQVELFIEILQYKLKYLSQETIFKLQSINEQQLKELLKHIFEIQNEKELVNVLVSL